MSFRMPLKPDTIEGAAIAINDQRNRLSDVITVLSP
jgi:hypothetical protein